MRKLSGTLAYPEHCYHVRNCFSNISVMPMEALLINTLGWSLLDHCESSCILSLKLLPLLPNELIVTQVNDKWKVMSPFQKGRKCLLLNRHVPPQIASIRYVVSSVLEQTSFFFLLLVQGKGKLQPLEKPLAFHVRNPQFGPGVCVPVAMKDAWLPTLEGEEKNKSVHLQHR